MEPDIPKRTNAFIELFPSIGLSSWIGNSAAVLTRCWRGFVAGIKHRRELSRLADLDDHMLADVGITRSDLHGTADMQAVSGIRAKLRRRRRRPGTAAR
jgi:uncharacterized protein YjiS (DUF1127 family)